MSIVNVILSGGVGSRLWPLSRKSQPKQYIPLFNSHTLFELCALRNHQVSDKLIVVGSIDNYMLSRDNLKNRGISNYSEIIEAVPRNTAAAIAFAAFSLDKDDIMLVTPSDHIIDGESLYKAAVERAVELAGQGNLVTFGIKPSYPETGYGYIEFAAEEVIAFREKPSYADAEKYVTNGGYLWNSGIFCFKAGVFLDELRRFEPIIYETAEKAWQQRDDGFLGKEASLLIPSKSIDYAVMERSENIKVIPSDFKWNDLGSFDAIWGYMEESGLVSAPNLSLGSDKHVEFVGVKDIIYVETSDAVLILNRKDSQDVKKVYERLEKESAQLL